MFSKKAMQHTRQAPGRDIHKHFSLAPARSHTITASNKASATAATRNPPPHPDPYKTGPKLAKRRRGHHTCHSTLSLPPAHPPPSLSHTLPHTSNHERAQTVKGGETPPACASPLSGVRHAAQQPQPQPQPAASPHPECSHASPCTLNDPIGTRRPHARARVPGDREDPFHPLPRTRSERRYVALFAGLARAAQSTGAFRLSCCGIWRRR